MAAAVLLIPIDKLNNNIERHSKVAYLTLERGIYDNGAETPVLCGWNGATHINLMTFLEDEPFQFCAAVEVALSNHLGDLVGEDEAKKWAFFQNNLRRTFASGGTVGSA